ncbi:hypothetical protein SKAU_G00297150 [Synaphobranchus kaupii]|uniref:Uncharacterized protein n=1 Tax=Synaphobranchus kaupii TaxID=118154 RepID=A0A9Q1ILX8_SYNKA|nr:hypothetical protein SKAU_G00297150 [Synaphobranchus kaupii]
MQRRSVRAYGRDIPASEGAKALLIFIASTRATEQSGQWGKSTSPPPQSEVFQEQSSTPDSTFSWSTAAQMAC